MNINCFSLAQPQNFFSPGLAATSAVAVATAAVSYSLFKFKDPHCPEPPAHSICETQPSFFRNTPCPLNSSFLQNALSLPKELAAIHNTILGPPDGGWYQKNTFDTSIIAQGLITENSYEGVTKFITESGTKEQIDAWKECSTIYGLGPESRKPGSPFFYKYTLADTLLRPPYDKKYQPCFEKLRAAVSLFLKFPDHPDVSKSMEKFAQALVAKRKSGSDPIETAAFAHMGLVNIHPFYDGNGRMARLLMNAVLVKACYPAVLTSRLDQAYYKAVSMEEKIPGFFTSYLRELINDKLQNPQQNTALLNEHKICNLQANLFNKNPELPCPIQTGFSKGSDKELLNTIRNIHEKISDSYKDGGAYRIYATIQEYSKGILHPSKILNLIGESETQTQIETWQRCVKLFRQNEDYAPNTDIIAYTTNDLAYPYTDLEAEKCRTEMLEMSKKYMRTHFQPLGEEIAPLMHAFVHRLKEKLGEERNRIETAAWAHVEMMKIYPFENKNEEVALILVNALLIDAGYSPLTLSNDEQKNDYDIAIREEIRTPGTFEAYLRKTLCKNSSQPE